MKVISAVLICGLLGGCVTAEQLAAQDDAKCRSFGAQPGSPPYIQCRTQLDSTRTQARAMIAASPTHLQYDRQHNYLLLTRNL